MREGWTYKKLGEVGNVVTGSTPSTKDAANYASPDYCFVKPSDLPSTGIAVIDDSEFHISAKAFESARQLPKGSIVVSCIGIIGKVGILNKDACTNQQINAIIPNGTIMPKCLAYIICYKKSELEQIANAPVVPIINKGEFSKFLISVPPISEQQSIVAELDKINELISLKKAQLSDLDALAQSIFYDMFGDPIENEKGWEVKLWSDVLTIINGKNQKSVECVGGEFPIYGSGGIMSYANNWLCPEECIIIGRKGNINKPIFVRTKFWNVDTAFGLDAKRDILSPTYLYYFCIDYDFERHNKAVTIPSLTKADLLKISIPLPPLPLQQEFAKRIELIEQQKAQISSTIKDLETLLASRMQYWFD